MRSLLIALLVFIILGFGVAIFLRIRVLKKRENDLEPELRVVKKKKVKSTKQWEKLYRAFITVPFSRRYLSVAYQQYEMLIPGDKGRIMQEAAKSFVRSFGLTVVLGVALVVVRPGWFWLGCYGVVIYVINDWALSKRTASLRKKLLIGCAEFIEKVRHEFYRLRMIDDAIEEAAFSVSPLMRGHVDKILDVVRAYDMDMALLEYNETVPNMYLKSFTAVAVSLIHNGDKRVNGQSLFLSNLANLKKDLNRELLNQKRKDDAFSGTVFVVVVPMFTTPFIADWAQGNLSGLESFYGGGFGILIPIVTLILTVLIYYMLNKLRAVEQIVIMNQGELFSRLLRIKPIKVVTEGLVHKSKRTSKQDALLRRVGSRLTVTHLYVQRVLFFIAAFGLCLVMLLSMHHADKQNLLRQTGDVTSINGATRAQKAELSDFVNKFMAEHKGEVYSAEELAQVVQAEVALTNKTLITDVAKILFDRLEAYNNEFFRWYEMLIVLCVSMVAYYVPYFLLLYRRKLIMLGMNDEIVQFQSIIIMLMHLQNMTAEVILQWLESFAVIFRPAISDCLSNYSYGEEKALSDLQAAEGYEPFERIVQNLQISDSVGIAAAFEEIGANRADFQDEIQLDAEISLRKKATIAKAISFIPGGFLVITYLILPFIIESFKGLSAGMTF